MSFTTALLAIGTGLQITQQIRQGKQQQQIFEFNAQVSQQKATLAKQSGKLRADRLRRQARTFSAKQTAAFAKAGVRLTGSPLQVLADTAAELELDARIEEFNTEVDVLNAQTNAQLDIIRGREARTLDGSRRCCVWQGRSILVGHGLAALVSSCDSMSRRKVHDGSGPAGSR